MTTLILLITILTGTYSAPLESVVLAPAVAVEAEPAEDDAGAMIYSACGLEGKLNFSAFQNAWGSSNTRDLNADVIAIADMTQPSTEKRLFLVDVKNHRLLLRTYVAHGQNTGELYAKTFSNRPGSHQSSKGMFRVGKQIISPKHGDAMLLHGLDHDVNHKALEREIIIHSADYVSEAFIAQHGRLGRSWGCPTVPKEDISAVIHHLADGGLLYIHAN